MKIVTINKMPHIRRLSLDPFVNLTFNTSTSELKIDIISTRKGMTVHIEQKTAIDDLIHSIESTEEGHVLPTLTSGSQVYIKFNSIKDYLAVCELCGLEPSPQIRKKIA